ncbi:TonB-dependent receptor [Shewanella denitrificans OS217]|jgi:hemoglobin/transferrin/lactoferrin receptor protein|uniref:TonB-dependent receptor n=1 Tax=Shewanella denitrificans (strain OS217 / ATCC BAA-1090 / DSM 15013) TaxID=318161 RepID=Q12M85_SHEDO|nr:TonB-dependent receptor [Shewanella denitrificans]ABE55441.1 TonB-dependent receptor [Shewanella denitrificans OS217]
MKLSYLSLAIASLLSGQVLSGQVLAAEVQELAVTEVKATKTKQNTVTSEKLDNRQVNDIKGALSELAGVSVSNGVRYSQKTYLRGMEEHSANVTIDGARQDGQMFHHAGNQMVDPSMLKAVSVELGASSVLSGYGANVGAISYVTKDPKDLLALDQKFGFKVATAADTATEFQQVSASGYGRLTDQLSLLGMMSWNESGDIETPDRKPIVNKHSELKSGLVKAVYDVDDNQQLAVSLQRFEDAGHRALSGEKPGATSVEEALGFNGYERDTYTVNYRNDSANPLLDLAVDAYYNQKKMVRGEQTGDFEIRDNAGKWQKQGIEFIPERDYSYKTLGLNIRNTMDINDIPWTVGIETFKSEQAIDAATGLITRNDGTKTTVVRAVNNGPEARLIGGYIQGEFNLGALQIIPGVRFDSYKLGGAYDNSFSQLSPKLNLFWQASETLGLKAGYGRIFKGPGLPETLMISSDMTASPDAKAETGNNLEFGVSYDFAPLVNLDSANIYANIYQYNIDNYYHPTKNNSLVRGISDLTKKGIEAGMTVQHQDLKAYVNYSYNTGEKAFDDYTTDDYYSGTHLVKLGLDYQLTDEMTLGWDSIFASSASLDDRSVANGAVITEPVEKAGYGVSNIWASYDVEQLNGLSLKLAVDNLFDKAYQDHNSFGMYWGNAGYNDNEVGRNFKFAVSYQY